MVFQRQSLLNPTVKLKVNVIMKANRESAQKSCQYSIHRCLIVTISSLTKVIWRKLKEFLNKELMKYPWPLIDKPNTDGENLSEKLSLGLPVCIKLGRLFVMKEELDTSFSWCFVCFHEHNILARSSQETFEFEVIVLFSFTSADILCRWNYTDRCYWENILQMKTYFIVNNSKRHMRFKSPPFFRTCLSEKLSTWAICWVKISKQSQDNVILSFLATSLLIKYSFVSPVGITSKVSVYNSTRKVFI